MGCGIKNYSEYFLWNAVNECVPKHEISSDSLV